MRADIHENITYSYFAQSVGLLRRIGVYSLKQNSMGTLLPETVVVHTVHVLHPGEQIRRSLLFPPAAK